MAVLDRVPVDTINAQARDVDFGRVLLTLIAGFFWLLGWVAGRLFTIIGLALAWIGLAVKTGWTEGRGTKPEPARI